MTPGEMYPVASLIWVGLVCLVIGGAVGVLTTGMVFTGRRQPAFDDDDRVVLTPEGRAALDETPPGPGFVPVSEYKCSRQAEQPPPAEDPGEARALAARAERRRRQKADNPQGFRPIVSNPDDPTDVVL